MNRSAGRSLRGRLAPLALCAAGACCAALAGPGAVVPIFTDATPGSGIEFRNVCGSPVGSKGWLNEGMGSGAGWLDYDGDGKLDLYLVNGSAFDRAAGKGEPNKLYRGDGKGKFTDVTAKAGVGDRGWGYGVAVGDFDNDGRPDLYVTNLGPNVLYRNRGDGTFENVTSKAGVEAPQYSSSSAFFDMDNDGDLDLYVGNYMLTGPGNIPRGGSKEAVSVYCVYKGIPVFCGPLGQVPLQDVLYRNDGDGTFTDVTVEAGLRLDIPRYTLGVVTADYDNDGDQDVYAANDSVANSLWQNQGNGKFVDVGLRSLAALNADGRPQAGMGTDFGDYNGDGWLDIVVTNFAHDLNTLYRNLGGRFFVDDSALVGLGVTQLALSWGTGFYDFNSDGAMDLFIANGHVYPQVEGHDLGTTFRQRNHLFVGEQKRLREVSAAAGPGMQVLRSFRGAAFADYDDDGDVDVLLTTLDDAPLLLRNDTAGQGHRLQVRLVGGAGSNRDGVGARVTVQAGGLRLFSQRKGGGSYESASDPRLHFGLGSAQKVDRIEVVWPGGRTQVLTDQPVDREITVEEKSAASGGG